jgi:hypothetical protein
MPQMKGQGHSSMTIDKQEGLGKILSQHISVVKVIFDKYPKLPRTYYFMDAYAGSGYNASELCDGSPLIFLKAIVNAGLDYRAWFIEKDEALSTELGKRVKDYRDRCEVCKGDNARIVPQIARTLPRNAYGLIYADPNGIPGFNLLSKISRIPGLEKFDILIRYNAVAVKRNEFQTGKKKMLDHLSEINKSYWIIRKLKPGDIWQWTFLLGMNWGGLNDWRSQGFMYAITPKGITPGAEEIINKLNNSRSQATLGAL